MKKEIFCLAVSEEQANRIVSDLMAYGFLNEDISVLYPNQNQNRRLNTEDQAYDDDRRINTEDEVVFDETSPSNRRGEVVTEKNTKAPEGGVVGATTGGVLGGSLGLLAGIGALAIPGLGPFIAAGPIMAALGGSAVGGSLGLLIGLLVGSGIPEYEAKKYEAGLKAGKILISVQTDNVEDVEHVKEIMQKNEAEDISASSEKAQSSY